MANELKYHMNMLNSIDRQVGGPGNWTYIIDALNSIDTNLGSVGISGLIELAHNAYPSESASGNPIYFDDGADSIPVKELIVNLEPKQSGSGNPSPSNVRPISGYDGVVVKRTGKNLIPYISDGRHDYVTFQRNDDGTYSISGQTATSTRITVSNLFDSSLTVANQNDEKKHLANGTYYVKVDGTGFALGVVGSNVSGTSGNALIWNGTEGTFTIDDTYKYNWVRLAQTGNVEISSTLSIMICESEADRSFEPYQCDAYPVSFGSAGTVYGGTLNVTTGELVADKYCMRVDGTKIPSIAALTNNYRIGIMNIATLFGAPAAKYAGNDTVCASNWLPKRNQGYSADTTGFYFYSNTAIYVFFPKSLIASQDIALARQYFVDHPLDICYELETPQTYQLTPTEVATILGNNTISSDGNIQLTYRADTTLLINKLEEAAA